MALVGAASLGLAWLEGQPLLVLLVLPGLVALVLPARLRAEVITSWAMVLVVVLGADAALTLSGRDGLGYRVARISAWVAWRTRPSTRLVPDDCAGHRIAPGDDLGPGPPRDAMGRQVLEGGDGSFRVLVVGDSVMNIGFARLLSGALDEAGVGHRVVDTSVWAYGWEAYRCLLDRDLHLEPWDLVIVGLVVNDLPIPDRAILDVGAGPTAYDLWSVIPDRLEGVATPPLLVDPALPWVQARERSLRTRWGERLVMGVNDPELLLPLLDGPVPDGKHGVDALHGALALVEEAGVPAAWLVFPLLYDVEPNPVDALLDWVVAQVEEGGGAPIDLRSAWVGLGAEQLARDPGRGMWDPLHPNDAALLIAADAALQVLADDHLEVARAALLSQAAELLPCATWTCAPAAPVRPSDGVHLPPPPCRPDGPLVCPALASP